MTEMKWQPIATAPKDEDLQVLVTDGAAVFVATWAYDDNWQPYGLPSWTPKYWMPCPLGPLEEAGAAEATPAQ